MEFDTLRHRSLREKQKFACRYVIGREAKTSFASRDMIQPARSGRVFALKKRAATMSRASVAAGIRMEGRHYFFNG